MLLCLLLSLLSSFILRISSPISLPPWLISSACCSRFMTALLFDHDPNGESFSPDADALPIGVGCRRFVGMLAADVLRASAAMVRRAAGLNVFIGRSWGRQYLVGIVYGDMAGDC
ncbi:hypothetical protein KC361_g52 [Hortaea werneckii]|nr:hypothetical protein KC361_g52 [Hortaea werneckii]